MAATIPSTALVPVQPVFTDAERLALAGYLAGYRGLTREAYTLDLRQFTGWCRVRSLPLFSVRRADIETYARDLEAKGRARATVTRRLCTIAGFYRYVVEEELLDHSPAAHVRRPRLDYESHATALDRNELGAILVAAGLGPPAEHALISLLALNGLRVSEATGADIEHLGLERGHRTLVITRKGGLVYVSLVIAQLALARRFGRDPAWRSWRPWLLASAAATALLLAAYAADVTGAAAAGLQRAAVTLPQAAVAVIAARLIRRGGLASAGPRPASTRPPGSTRQTGCRPPQANLAVASPPSAKRPGPGQPHGRRKHR